MSVIVATVMAANMAVIMAVVMAVITSVTMAVIMAAPTAVPIFYSFTSIPEWLYKPTNLQTPHLTNQFPTATNEFYGYFMDKF
jgi:hypothetical protein